MHHTCVQSMLAVDITSQSLQHNKLPVNLQPRPATGVSEEPLGGHPSVFGFKEWPMTQSPRVSAQGAIHMKATIRERQSVVRRRIWNKLFASTVHLSILVVQGYDHDETSLDGAGKHDHGALHNSVIVQPERRGGLDPELTF